MLFSGGATGELGEGLDGGLGEGLRILFGCDREGCRAGGISICLGWLQLLHFPFRQAINILLVVMFMVTLNLGVE